MQIKNIIFDLGGVILDLDFQRTFTAFQKLGVDQFSDIYNQAKQDGLFDDFETGKISAAHFRGGLRERLGIAASDEEIDRAWNAMLLTFPKERLDFIKNLHTQYQVFLFSNTNEIHLEAFYQIAKQILGGDHFNEYFHKVYYSHLFKQRKPHPESFIAILNENLLLPDQTLFIDDTLQHIQGAQKVGLHTLHLTKDASLFDIINVIQS